MKAIFVVCLFFLNSLQASDKLISVYLTWESDPCHTMIVQWITPIEEEDNRLIFFKKDQEPVEVLGEHQQLPYEIPFVLHRVGLSHLDADTDYYFQLPVSDETYKFHTLPENLENPISFVVGGEIYQDDLSFARKTCKAAAKTDPLFAVLGGNLAKTCAFKQKLFEIAHEHHERWFELLAMWTEEMVTTDGCLIPIVPVVGEQEVKGFMFQSSYTWPLKPKAPFFQAFFPFPGKKGYNVLDFGNYMSLWILDSAHIAAIDIEKRWARKTLNLRQSVLHKFVAQDNPIFPATYNKIYYGADQMHRFFAKLFEKCNVDAVFEHHEKVYKKTFPIKKKRVNPRNGILYIGGGAWGVEHPPTIKKEKWYIDTSLPVRHFLKVTIDSSSECFTAIDDEGNVIDETKKEKRS